MILIISICKEKLHYLEFVKPIENILNKGKIGFFTKHHFKLINKNLEKADKVIICGTSLADNEFVKYVHRFNWIKNFNKPVLGICGGMQIIGLVFNERVKKEVEIGYYFENFRKEFLGLKGKQEVYHLHNNYVDFGKAFEEFVNSKIPQAVKHREKEIYGVLFHPEVRNKKMIINFIINS